MKFIRKVKIKLKSIFFDLLIKFSLAVNSPYLTALSFYLIASRVNHSGKHTVLVFGRSIFTDDIQAMAEQSGQIKYYIINFNYFYLIFNHCFDTQILPQIIEEDYHINQIFDQGKNKYYNYLEKMLPHLQRFLKIDAFMSSNIGYTAQQEMARLCRHKKISFIILHKEGLSGLTDKDHRKGLYKNRIFLGDKILLYNQEIKELFLDIQVPGITKDNSVVVGIPRLDVYFNSPNIKPKKQIVFFSFYPHDKFELLIRDKHKKELAIQRSNYFHELIMCFAKNHPEYNVIIKTKAAKHFLDYINKIYQDKFGDKKLSNLIITNAGSSTQYILESSAVIAFFSTTLIEAIISNKTIISPYFADLIKDKKWDYFGNYPELVNYASNYNQLENFILNHDQYKKYDPQRRKDFLKRLIYTPDGQASRRAENEIIKAIQKFKN